MGSFTIVQAKEFELLKMFQWRKIAKPKQKYITLRIIWVGKSPHDTTYATRNIFKDMWIVNWIHNWLYEIRAFSINSQQVNLSFFESLNLINVTT